MKKIVGTGCLIATALTLGLMQAVTPPALAGKPGGGGTPPPPLDVGWVYYYGHENSVGHIRRSSPDGTTQGAVAGAPAAYSLGPSVGMPSELTHDGSRWYLAMASDNFDIVFPGMGTQGEWAREIDVIREGDAVGTRLTDNRGACIAVVPGSASNTRPMWVNNAAGTRDAAVSWLGVQWADQDSNAADCETLVGAGIFRADLVYTGGVVTGIGTPVLAVPLGMGSDGRPDAADFAWSPDASAVAYSRNTSSGGGGPLMRAAAGSAPGSHTQLVAGRYFDVEWSPDQDTATAGLQTTVAYTGWSSGRKVTGGVWGIQPNGSGVKLLAQATQGTTSYVHYSPMWSPAGSHLAYVEAGDGGALGFPGIRQLRRMAKDGSGNVVLVSPGPSYNSVLWGLNWTDVD